VVSCCIFLGPLTPSVFFGLPLAQARCGEGRRKGKRKQQEGTHWTGLPWHEHGISWKSGRRRGGCRGEPIFSSIGRKGTLGGLVRLWTRESQVERPYCAAPLCAHSSPVRSARCIHTIYLSDPHDDLYVCILLFHSRSWNAWYVRFYSSSLQSPPLPPSVS